MLSQGHRLSSSHTRGSTIMPLFPFSSKPHQNQYTKTIPIGSGPSSPGGDIQDIHYTVQEGNHSSSNQNRSGNVSVGEEEQPVKAFKRVVRQDSHKLQNDDDQLTVQYGACSAMANRNDKSSDLIIGRSRHNHQRGTQVPQSWAASSSPSATSDAVAHQRPRPLKFIEGDELLKQLPKHILSQLRTFCARHDTDVPDCVRKKWGFGRAFSSYEGRRIEFFVYGSSEELLSARYQYGDEHQVLLVAGKSGSAFNGGKAAIVVAAKGKIHQMDTDPKGSTRVPYAIWSGGQLSLPLAVDRRLGPKNCVYETWEAVSQIGQTVNGYDPSPEAAEEISMRKDTKSTPHSSLSGQQHLRPEPILSGKTQEPRQSGSTHLKPQTVGKRSRAASNGSADSDRPLGDKYKKGKSHGSSVNVQSKSSVGPLSSANNYLSRSGMTNQKLRNSLAADTICVRTEADASPGRQASINANENKSVDFVFKKSPEDKRPRVKNLRDCNTARKLSCQATTHGVSVEQAPGLVLLIGTSEERFIMRNDEEDFEDLMKYVQDRDSSEHLEIIVLPMEE